MKRAENNNSKNMVVDPVGMEVYMDKEPQGGVMHVSCPWDSEQAKTYLARALLCMWKKAASASVELFWYVFRPYSVSRPVEIDFNRKPGPAP